MRPLIKQQTWKKSDTSEFSKDVRDLFSGARAGHMSKWLYSSPEYAGDKACGVDAWAQVASEAKNGSPYYIFRAEEEIIKAAVEKISFVAKSDTRIVDLGPGSLDAVQNKVGPIINEIKGSLKEYVAVDVCAKSLDIAKEAIQERALFSKTEIINADFIQDYFKYGDTIDTEIALLFGLTLCNLPIDPMVEGLPEMMLAASLRRIKSHLASKNGYLIITQDINQDIHSLRDAYETRRPVYMTLPHLIARDVFINGYFNPDGFDMDVEFIPQTQACAMSLVANEDMNFISDGMSVSLKKGKRLHFHNAFKFDEETFLKAAQTAGFRLEHTEKVAGNPCLLHVFSSN